MCFLSFLMQDNYVTPFNVTEMKADVTKLFKITSHWSVQ